ncbi:MAG: hypothetical protein IT237_13940 [Bacteroidia bacterium]|nr:hypothetical protein [Bacteroidia bacterium]
MTNDNFDLVKKLLYLPWYNLILLSLLVIPIFIGAWTVLFSTFKLDLSDNQKKYFALCFILVYIIGLTIGKVGHDKEQSANISKTIEALKVDLKSNGGLMGFRRIRERHPSYTEDLLYQIADNYPNVFGVTPIADPNDSKSRDKDDPFGLILRQK